MTQDDTTPLSAAWLAASIESLAHWEHPAAEEHDAYYSRYIELVPAGDLVTFTRDQITEVVALFGSLSNDQAELTYAPGKWTLKEVLCHLIDTERVFGHRALAIARRDRHPLSSFDQDAWIPPAHCALRSLDGLLREWVAVRLAFLAMITGLPPEAPNQTGISAGKTITVRALAHIPPGHVRYHLDHVRIHYLGAKSPS